MLSVAAVIALLNNPLAQLGGKFALTGVNNGFTDLHSSIQLDLYHRETVEILYRGQVMAYLSKLQTQRKVTYHVSRIHVLQRR
jgi:hypothetical protein